MINIDTPFHLVLSTPTLSGLWKANHWSIVSGACLCLDVSSDVQLLAGYVAVLAALPRACGLIVLDLVVVMLMRIMMLAC